MKDEKVILAKKELVKFLKKHNAVALYFWTVYGCNYNSKNVENTLKKIKHETQPKQLCMLYEDLIGKLRLNTNIETKK